MQYSLPHLARAWHVVWAAHALGLTLRQFNYRMLKLSDAPREAVR